MIKKQYIILVFAFLLFNACNTDDLEVSNGSAISTETFPASRAELEGAINGAYSPLQSQGLFGRYIPIMFDYMGGECKVNGGEAHMLEFVIAAPTAENPDPKFTFTASNNDIYLYWKNAYNGISRCNFILDTTTKINALDPASAPQADKDDFIGQAKFLRAFYYFLLVERFGDIPLYTTTIGLDPTGLPKSSKADVYALIIKDLEEASTQLKSVADAEAGRVTKQSANALLGKVYLYQHDYANAQTTFNKVITSGEYSLVADYSDNFFETNENNSESLFEVQFTYSGGGSWAYADWGGQDNGDSETTFRSIQNGAIGGWRNSDPSQDAINQFEVGDPRLQANFYFTGDAYSGGTVDTGADPAFWRKYQKSLNQGTDGNGLCDINHRVIRYADVLLMAAEVLNETGGTIDGKDAVGLMNMVRDRVSMPNYGTATMNATYPVTSHDEILAALDHERRVELVGEESRFFDLLRWGRANEIPGFVIGKHELFPIPQQEFDTNPHISVADQNPGY